ncbi:hypothetical protein TIFTF001_000748 [Ficus carica]|uniref:Uncharacterized protein n=1 Tax=Ficus carica TaxID=3494 RepID=A0AA87YWX0_FICCA|nr:hypothetical protein TIFTF001_000748 [Ficus carica]
MLERVFNHEDVCQDLENNVVRNITDLSLLLATGPTLNAFSLTRSLSDSEAEDEDGGDEENSNVEAEETV